MHSWVKNSHIQVDTRPLGRRPSSHPSSICDCSQFYLCLWKEKTTGKSHWSIIYLCWGENSFVDFSELSCEYEEQMKIPTFATLHIIVPVSARGARSMVAFATKHSDNRIPRTFSGVARLEIYAAAIIVACQRFETTFEVLNTEYIFCEYEIYNSTVLIIALKSRNNQSTHDLDLFHNSRW